MRRFHVALAVDDLRSTIADYSARLGAEPVAVVEGTYALWRTDEVNLSVHEEPAAAGRLRHVGFEDDDAAARTEERDVNGLLWESFSPTWQDEGIVRVYGRPAPPSR